MSALKRGLAAAATAAIVGSLLAACGGSDSSANASGCSSMQKATFGYIGDFNGTSLLAIAQNKGMWAEHCLDVTTKVFTDGPTQITALDAGSLDFGYIGPGALWLPAEGKAQIVSLDTFTNADRIVALPGKGISTIQDLKGKTVGYPAGTSGEMILRLGLKSVGMSMSDVKAVPMDYPTLTAALASGKVDAAGFGYPQLTTVKKTVPDIIELAKDSDFSATFRFPTAFVSQPDMTTKNPGLVKAVVATLKEANDYRAQNEDDAISQVAAWNKQPVDDVKADAQYDQLEPTSFFDTHSKNGDVDKWLTSFNQYFQQVGTLTTTPADPSTYYTSDVYLEAGK